MKIRDCSLKTTFIHPLTQYLIKNLRRVDSGHSGLFFKNHFLPSSDTIFNQKLEACRKIPFKNKEMRVSTIFPYFFWIKVCMLNLCSIYVSMSKSFISSKNVNRQTLSFYTCILPAAIFSYASLCDIEHIKRKSMENTQYKVSCYMPYYFRIPATITFNILHYVRSR